MIGYYSAKDFLKDMINQCSEKDCSEFVINVLHGSTDDIIDFTEKLALLMEVAKSMYKRKVANSYESMQQYISDIDSIDEKDILHVDDIEQADRIERAQDMQRALAPSVYG